MKQPSETISTELEQLEARRESLAADTEAARVKLDAAREQLVSSATGAKQVTQAQAEYSALDEALKSLDERIETKRTKRDATRAAELKEANRLRHAELGQTRRALQSEYDEAAAAADAQLAEVAERLLDLRRRDAEARTAMETIYPSAAAFTDRGLIDRPLRFGVALAQAVGVISSERDRTRIKASSHAATERREQQERERQRERQRRTAEAQPEAA
jgi:hypothetical protein